MKKITLLIAVLLLVSLLAGCGGSAETSGVAATETVKAAQTDPKTAGEEAFARQDYEAAVAFFEQLGDEGYRLWAEAKCALILQEFTPENYEAAWEELSQLHEDHKSRNFACKAQVELLRQLIQTDIVSLEQLEQMASSIPIQTTIGLPELYRALGDRCLAQDGLTYFEKGDMAAPYFKLSAAQNIGAALKEIVEQLVQEEEFYAAASLIWETQDDLSLSQTGDLFNILSRYVHSTSFASVDQYLQADRAVQVADAALGGSRDEDPERLRQNREHAADVSSIVQLQAPQTNEYQAGARLVLASSAEIDARCGQAPAGKILFLLKEPILGTEDYVWSIPMGLMRSLPTDRYPITLEEVEYIVCITGSYKKVGKYDSGSPALQQSAQVQVLHPADGTVGYNSKTIKGDQPPRSHKYFGSPSPFVSGGSPDVTKAVLAAYDSIAGEG